MQMLKVRRMMQMLNLGRTDDANVVSQTDERCKMQMLKLGRTMQMLNLGRTDDANVVSQTDERCKC